LKSPLNISSINFLFSRIELFSLDMENQSSNSLEIVFENSRSYFGASGFLFLIDWDYSKLINILG